MSEPVACQKAKAICCPVDLFFILVLISRTCKCNGSDWYSKWTKMEKAVHCYQYTSSILKVLRPESCRADRKWYRPSVYSHDNAIEKARLVMNPPHFCLCKRDKCVRKIFSSKRQLPRQSCPSAGLPHSRGHLTFGAALLHLGLLSCLVQILQKNSHRNGPRYGDHNREQVAFYSGFRASASPESVHPLAATNESKPIRSCVCAYRFVALEFRQLHRE